MGLLLQMPVNLCLRFGIYAASYYIINGKSPDFDELADFIYRVEENK